MAFRTTGARVMAFPRVWGTLGRLPGTAGIQRLPDTVGPAIRSKGLFSRGPMAVDPGLSSFVRRTDRREED